MTMLRRKNITFFALSYITICLVNRFSNAQRDRRPDESMPPGLEQWIGIDECDKHQRWVDFYHGLANAIQHTKTGNLATQELKMWMNKGINDVKIAQSFTVPGALRVSNLDSNNNQIYPIHSDPSALGLLRNLTDPYLTDPRLAFQCSTAMFSAFNLLSQIYHKLDYPVLGLRAQQHASLFGSFDYQMKGEQFIESSVWPISWKESVDNALVRMDRVQRLVRNRDQWRRDAIPRKDKNHQTNTKDKYSVAIVSVCDYNEETTPLYTLSYHNKKAYADKHGYTLYLHSKSPWFKDKFTRTLFNEPKENRPPAWSKIDAVLEVIRENKYDWVMWMDCDSFFMDQELSIGDMVDWVEGLNEKNNGKSEESKSKDQALQQTLEDWDSSDGSQESFDQMLRSSSSSDSDPASSQQDPTNIGWDSWLLDSSSTTPSSSSSSQRTELIVSEDGLMLNTGIFFVRGKDSLWGWRFFQKVRRFTFGHRAPITQHPWWEQTAMVWLTQLPFGGVEDNKNLNVAPGVRLLDQKHINPYPELVASALLTHKAYTERNANSNSNSPSLRPDWIISFSGCKIYSSQDVCNALFFNYFAKSVPNYEEIASKDERLKKWLEKGERLYR